MSEPGRLGQILPDVMADIDLRRQRHAEKVMKAIQDYHRDRKRRTGRSMTSRKTAATASLALQDGQKAAGDTAGRGLFRIEQKDAVF